MILSAERARELLAYDPETGVLAWRERVNVGRGWGSEMVGRPAGTVTKRGYLQIRIEGRLLLAHRIVWLIVYGEWPKATLDHINRDGCDNRLCNLRQATQGENNQNIGMKTNNTSGFMGVTKTASGTWKAQIKVAKRYICLGSYPTAQEASGAYLQAKARLHPFSPEPHL